MGDKEDLRKFFIFFTRTSETFDFIDDWWSTDRDRVLLKFKHKKCKEMQICILWFASIAQGSAKKCEQRR